MKNKTVKKILTWLFYVLIGITASLALATISYLSLTKDASIGMLVQNTKAQVWYFWPYVVSTGLIIILFGINVPIIVHRIRKFGWVQFKKLFTKQGPAGLGGFIAVAATACFLLATPRHPLAPNSSEPSQTARTWAHPRRMDAYFRAYPEPAERRHSY